MYYKKRKTCQMIKSSIVQLIVDCHKCNQSDGLDPPLVDTSYPPSESSCDQPFAFKIDKELFSRRSLFSVARFEW